MAKIIEETSDNGANIISIKAFNKNGDGSIASLYAAIELARELDVKDHKLISNNRLQD